MSAQELLEHGFFVERIEKSTKEVEYYLTQLDINGRPARYQITEDLYNFYVEEKRLANKLSNWNKNHRDMRELEYLLLTSDYKRASEHLAQEQQSHDTLADVALILKTCTKVEQRRFTLKFVQGYTYAEIARLEKRSEASIKESVYKAIAKMNKLKTL